MRPLDGITVITLEHAIAGPFCTRQLADLGARVIKVERPDGGDFARAYDQRARGLSSYFVWCNRSKESLTLDVKQQPAKDILDKLVSQADVLVQNLAPGASARLGLSYDELSKKFPKLIVCDISGYGENGSYRDKKAYDVLIQSESGLVSVTGTPDQPCKAGSAVSDISASMYAYTNILAAIILRGKTGKGSHIDVSMFESTIEWMNYALYYSIDGAPVPPRSGASHPAIYPYGPFPTGDGKIVMLGLQNEREWVIFCEKVLHRPEVAKDPRFTSVAKRSAARKELDEIIFEVFSTLTIEEVVKRLDEAPIANSRLNDMHDLWAHQQLKDRNRWVEVKSSVGMLPALYPPGMPGAYTPRMDPVPALGEHSEKILTELGYDEMQITQLRDAHVI